MKNFQLIMLIVFIVAAILGVLVFSGAIPIGKSDTPGVGGTVVLWGTLNQQLMAPAVADFNTANPNYILKYVQKSPATFDQNLLEALASGTGPDIFLLPNDLAYHYSNRILPISYQSFSLASFKSSFASAGEVFLNSKGILALPLMIDPMVMYYNRSALDSNNIVNPPVYWDELQNLITILNKKDQDKQLVKSAFALGQFANVTHAKDIISTIFMQSGNPIVAEKNGSYFSVMKNSSQNFPDLSNALQFYTSFADPTSNAYSWNRALPQSIDAFSAENLAFYFGYASELPALVSRNPNQNFLVAPMLQLRNSSTKVTFGRVLGVSVLSSSKNPTGALTVATLLVNSDFASKISTALSVAPARRDLLSIKQTDAYFPIFYSSALFTKSWLDPSPQNTDDIFQAMVENVLSGNKTADQSLTGASAQLGLLLGS
ncbi:MAG: extracellular solute-binding protein [Patescibacteria group bacterium]